MGQALSVLALTAACFIGYFCGGIASWMHLRGIWKELDGIERRLDEMEKKN
jgi:hypothetical protein